MEGWRDEGTERDEGSGVRGKGKKKRKSRRRKVAANDEEEK